MLVPGVPKDLSGRTDPPESLLRLPDGQGRPYPTGLSPYQTRHRPSTRRDRPNSGGCTPPEGSGMHGTGHRAARRGPRCRPRSPPPVPARSRPASVPAHRSVACGEPLCPPHATWCRDPTGFPPRPGCQPGAPWRALPADSSIYRPVHCCRTACTDHAPSPLQRRDMTVAGAPARTDVLRGGRRNGSRGPKSATACRSPP